MIASRFGEHSTQGDLDCVRLLDSTMAKDPRL